MTEWTPALEQAIRKVGDFMEAQAKDGYDPAPPVEQTLKSIVDRFNNVGKMAYLDAFRAAGLTPSLAPERFRNNLDALVGLAQANGSDAADKIIKVGEMEKQLRAKYPEMSGLTGDSEEVVAKILKISKTAGFNVL